jgi:hypothetical protein
MSVPGTKLPMSAAMPLSGIIRTWRRRPNSLENDPNRTSLYLSESNLSAEDLSYEGADLGLPLAFGTTSPYKFRPNPTTYPF